MVDPKDPEAYATVRREVRQVGAERLFYLADAFRLGMSEAEAQH